MPMDIETLTCLKTLEQVIALQLESLRLYHEHVFRLTVSLQSLRDAIEADNPKLFQMFQKDYAGQEKLTAQAMSELAQRANEQSAPLQQMRQLLQTIESSLKKTERVN